MTCMNANVLIKAKKELRKLQIQLGREMSKGKYKDTVAIKELKKKIKIEKLKIGKITKTLITQMTA